MKSILTVSILAITLLTVVPAPKAWADEGSSNRRANPGDDPNLDMKSGGAGVAASGMCRECVSNMVHDPLWTNTNKRPSLSGDGNGGSETGVKGTR